VRNPGQYPASCSCCSDIGLLSVWRRSRPTVKKTGWRQSRNVVPVVQSRAWGAGSPLAFRTEAPRAPAERSTTRSEFLTDLTRAGCACIPSSAQPKSRLSPTIPRQNATTQRRHVRETVTHRRRCPTDLLQRGPPRRPRRGPKKCPRATQQTSIRMTSPEFPARLRQRRNPSTKSSGSGDTQSVAGQYYPAISFVAVDIVSDRVARGSCRVCL